MNLILKFLLLIWICASINAVVVPKEPNETYFPNASPVYYDPAQQQSGLLGLGQNIPIIGTLVSGLPILGNGQNLLGGLPGNLGGGLNGITSGLTGTLGNLGGGLGNLGQLGNIAGLGNLGPLGGGTAPSFTNAASCPASQKLSCRCESLIPVKPLGTRGDHNNDIIEIEDQSIKRNIDGSTEVTAHLSNGIIMYQKTNSPMVPKEIDGYYTLKVAEERYLTIYYTINDLDYTVKADVHSQPPSTPLEISDGHQNILGSFQ